VLNNFIAALLTILAVAIAIAGRHIYRRSTRSRAGQSIHNGTVGSAGGVNASVTGASLVDQVYIAATSLTLTGSTKCEVWDRPAG
jgi:hypothetical protein